MIDALVVNELVEEVVEFFQNWEARIPPYTGMSATVFKNEERQNVTIIRTAAIIRTAGSSGSSPYTVMSATRFKDEERSRTSS